MLTNSDLTIELMNSIISTPHSQISKLSFVHKKKNNFNHSQKNHLSELVTDQLYNLSHVCVHSYCVLQDWPQMRISFRTPHIFKSLGANYIPMHLSIVLFESYAGFK